MSKAQLQRSIYKRLEALKAQNSQTGPSSHAGHYMQSINFKNTQLNFTFKTINYTDMTKICKGL